MPIAVELLIPLGVALVVIVQFVLVRAKAKRNRARERPSVRSPANLNFVCAGCEGRFTHTKRTLGAWEKGARRFYCNACHREWRTSHPAQPAQETGSPVIARRPNSTRTAESPHFAGSNLNSHSVNRSPRAASGSGCLGVALLLIAIPVALAFAIAQYV